MNEGTEVADLKIIIIAVPVNNVPVHRLLGNIVRKVSVSEAAVKMAFQPIKIFTIAFVPAFLLKCWMTNYSLDIFFLIFWRSSKFINLTKLCFILVLIVFKALRLLYF